ncbi:hypothetical protein FOZ70_16870 [Burkholderia sp. COPS]|uniref:hypothetical protein n=1 Tax=Burkholderia sp. COPS TaxID=2597663 RepID=UPI001CA5EF85|nr:hypothetical protein [Burkholderia sp. COPS]MBW5806406.1 hypothetical protein [Burkholderia sp. COPS]
MLEIFKSCPGSLLTFDVGWPRIEAGRDDGSIMEKHGPPRCVLPHFAALARQAALCVPRRPRESGARVRFRTDRRTAHPDDENRRTARNDRVRAARRAEGITRGQHHGMALL